uniref:Uncharacterized protein n=3 Tax=Felidae TaxID=9681 RepID=A0ABI8A9P6_FELCA
MDYSIHSFSKHKTDFSQYLYSSEKNLVTKNILSANLVIPGLQFEGLGSHFLPEMWTSLDMKGQE